MNRAINILFVVLTVSAYVYCSFNGQETTKELIYKGITEAMTCLALIAFIKTVLGGTSLKVLIKRDGKIEKTYTKRYTSTPKSVTGSALALAGKRGLEEGCDWAIQSERDITVKRKSCEEVDSYFSFASFADVAVVEIDL